MADYFTTRAKVPNIPKGQFSTVMRPFTALQAISNTGGKGLLNNFFNPKGSTAAEVAQSRYGFVDYPPFYDLEGNLKPARGLLYPLAHHMGEDFLPYKEWGVTPKLVKDALTVVEAGGGRHITPEEAFEGYMGPAGGLISSSLARGALKGSVDPSTLRMFAGEGARKADKTALKTAKEMSEAGASRDKIWKETGWFKDKDGWKFEIDDSKAQFSDQIIDWPGRYDAGESLTHGQLYSNYPDVAAIPVKPLSDLDAGGSYAYKAPGRSESIGLDISREADDVKSSLLHELQHSIQDREKFAKGGSLESAPSATIRASKQKMDELGGRRLLNKFDAAHKEAAELHSVQRINDFRSIKRPRDLFNSMYWYKYSDQVRRELGPPPKRSGQKRNDWISDAGNFIANKLELEHKINFPLGDKFARYRYGYKFDDDKKALKNHLRRAEYALDKFDRPQIQQIRKAEEAINSSQQSINRPLTTEEKYEIYRRLAGEAEARNVQTRMDFSPQQRKETPPWKTLDVPEDELIYTKYY
tara:strand:+ start:2282 stop:3862 length:1581 start_codon:yes stop_codon:yes gene_type:complete